MSQMAYVLTLPCAICQALGMQQIGRTFAHHIRTGQGGSQRAHDELTVPLCLEHHQGKTGIHGDRSAWRLAKLDELDVLAEVIRGRPSVPRGTARKVNPKDAPAYIRPSKIVCHRGYSR